MDLRSAILAAVLAAGTGLPGPGRADDTSPVPPDPEAVGAELIGALVVTYDAMGVPISAYRYLDCSGPAPDAAEAVRREILDEDPAPRSIPQTPAAEPP